MKNWIAFISYLLVAPCSASVISFTWDGDMVNSMTSEHIHTNWSMSIDSESKQFTEIAINSSEFNISLSAPASISMPWDHLLQSYMGYSYATGQDETSAVWQIEMYEFWIPTQDEVSNPFEAIPNLTKNPPILHVYLSSNAFAGPLYWGGHVSNFQVVPPTSEEPGANVPEPASIALLGLGLAASAFRRRGKRQP